MFPVSLDERRCGCVKSSELIKNLAFGIKDDLPFEALRRASVASQLELYQFLPGSAAGVALWAPGGALAPSAAGYPGLPLVCLC